MEGGVFVMSRWGGCRRRHFWGPVDVLFGFWRMKFQRDLHPIFIERDGLLPRTLVGFFFLFDQFHEHSACSKR